MNDFIYKHRFLISRRVTQILILILYFGANAYGWGIVSGNLSSSFILGFIPFSDPFAALQIFFTGAVVATDIIIGSIIIVFLYGVIAGRFFCAWICPVNMITDTAAWLRKKLNLKDKEDSQTLSRNIRYWIILLTFILSYVFSLAAFEMISPIGIAHRGIIFGFGFGWLFLVAIFIFDLLSENYGWCGHICPLGGFNAIIGKYSVVKVIHDKNKCSESMECFKVCPEKQILYMVNKISMPILDGTCIKCGRCIEVCDNNAFEFSLVSMAKQVKETS